MKIAPNIRVKDLQKAFLSQFPGLRIEFYKKEHAEREGSPPVSQIDPDTMLKDIMEAQIEEEFSIDPSMTVASLESYFEDKYGLHAQVFRRSAAIWLQTTATDSWTLEIQNRKGLHSLEAVD